MLCLVPVWFTCSLQTACQSAELLHTYTEMGHVSVCVCPCRHLDTAYLPVPPSLWGNAKRSLSRSFLAGNLLMSLAAEVGGVCMEEVKKRHIRKAWVKCGFDCGIVWYLDLYQSCSLPAHGGFPVISFGLRTAQCSFAHVLFGHDSWKCSFALEALRRISHSDPFMNVHSEEHLVWLLPVVIFCLWAVFSSLLCSYTEAELALK